MPDHPIPEAVVFDLGGVLIDWDPRYLYRTMFDDEAEMETFLAEVVSQEWNARQDAGRPWSEAIETLAREHPEHRERIAAYWDRWTETLGEAIEDAVEVLRELRDRGHVRLYALTNWSGETFPLARPRFPFLEWFDGIVVSGDEKLAKPDERLFRVLLARYELTPERTVYIDDSAANVRVAEDLGMVAVPFIGGVALRATLVALGLLSRAPAPSPAPPAS